MEGVGGGIVAACVSLCRIEKELIRIGGVLKDEMVEAHV